MEFDSDITGMHVCPTTCGIVATQWTLNNPCGHYCCVGVESHSPCLYLLKKQDGKAAPATCQSAQGIVGETWLPVPVFEGFRVSHSLNSLKRGYMGDYIGNYYRGY